MIGLAKGFDCASTDLLLSFDLELKDRPNLGSAFGECLPEMCLDEGLKLLPTQLDNRFYQIDDDVALSITKTTLLGRMIVRMCVRSISSNLL